jgi:hypothetical protein
MQLWVLVSVLVWLQLALELVSVASVVLLWKVWLVSLKLLENPKRNALIAALIEVAALFALVICLLISFKTV